MDRIFSSSQLRGLLRAGHTSISLLLAAQIFSAPAFGGPVPDDKPAAYPSWWFQRDIVRQSAQPPSSTPSWWQDYPPADDFAGLNAGQLKAMATATYDEFQANLPGGASPAIQSLVKSWFLTDAGGNFILDNQGGRQPKTTPSTDSYALVNLGQLKAVAKLFFDQLISWHYLESYPWSNRPTDDYAAANLGQLKYLFSFDLTTDTDHDGMPDWWELAAGLDPNDPNDASQNAPNPNLPSNGGIPHTNGSAFQNGVNPSLVQNPLNEKPGTGKPYEELGVTQYASLNLSSGYTSGSIGGVAIDNNNLAFSYTPSGGTGINTAIFSSGVIGSEKSYPTESTQVVIDQIEDEDDNSPEGSFLYDVSLSYTSLSADGRMAGYRSYMSTSDEDHLNPYQSFLRAFVSDSGGETVSWPQQGGNRFSELGILPQNNSWAGLYSSRCFVNLGSLGYVTGIFSGPSGITGLLGNEAGLGWFEETFANQEAALYDPIVFSPGGASAGSYRATTGGTWGWAVFAGGAPQDIGALRPMAVSDSGVVLGDRTDAVDEHNSLGIYSTNGFELLSSRLPKKYVGKIRFQRGRFRPVWVNDNVDVVLEAEILDESDPLVKGKWIGKQLLWRNVFGGGATPTSLSVVEIPSYTTPSFFNNRGVFAVVLPPSPYGAGGQPAAQSGAGILVPVEPFLDDASRQDDDDLSVHLDEWQQSESAQRSPKFLLAENDNIFVKIPGLPGLGNNRLKVKVTSESDPVGIVVDLVETSSGVYVNKSPAKPLRLGKTTEAKSDCVTIKVVDEEVLKFNLIFDGVNTEGPGVMVDRAEFASAGISVFYGNTTGDRATVRQQAITTTRFFDAGDGNYPNDIGATGSALSDFAKNFGSNLADSRQADFLHISAHGDVDGKIYDDTGALAIDPANLKGKWNSDAEWVQLATCNQLNVAGGGRAAWEPVMNGSPRKAHAILGAYKPLSGDLRNQLTAFWTDLRENHELILDAYGDAMGSGADPQPWAFLVNADNIQDKLKEVTRDSSRGVSFAYLDVSTVCGRAGGPGDRAITQTVDGGNGLIRTDIPSVEGLSLRKGFKLNPSSDFSKSKKLAFAQEVGTSTDGRHNFVGRKTTKTLSQTSTLTQEQAGEIAKQYLATHFPEFGSRVLLKEVGQKTKGDWLPGGGEKTQINGYLVRFSVVSDGVPVWNNYVNVTINGNEVDGVEFRVYEQTATATPPVLGKNALRPLDIRDGLAKSLPLLKKALNIKSKYEILKSEICYVNRKAALGGDTDLTDDFVPAWHLIINSEYRGEKSLRRLFHVWMDASTGAILGKKPY